MAQNLIDMQATCTCPGPSEGVFGWVAANYASGALQGYALRQGLRLRKPGVPSAPFVGVFELGGASAQVSHSFGNRTTPCCHVLQHITVG